MTTLEIPFRTFRAVAALACAAALAAASTAEGATYSWQISSGTTIAGITTNWTEACGTSPTAARITTMTTAALSCAGSTQRVSDTRSGGNDVMLTMVRDTTYASTTAISGGSFIASLRNGTGANSISADFQLGYVSGGVFTGFGTPVAQAMTTTQTTYTINLSSQTGTVPAGAVLALRVRKVQAVTDDARLYLGSTSGSSGTLTVTEAAATITLGNNTGTEASNATICAAPAVATYIDYFTLLAPSATNVNTITTTFSPTVPAGLLSLLEVTADTGVAQGSIANPSGLNPAVSGMSFAAPTGTAAQYRLRITPSATATTSGSFTATVTGVTNSAGLAVTGTDASSATITVDGQASPDVTVATATPTAGTVTASWTNPAAGTVPATDFGNYVVVLGNTVAITGAPAEGTSTYAAGGTVGADSVVCAGNLTTCARTGLAANQPYYLEIFTRDGCANWSAGVRVTATTPNSTTIADGTNPAAASLAPGGAETPLDAFTLQTGSGTDTVTAATVTLAAGTSAGLSSVRIMSGASCTGTQYGSVVPAGDTVGFSGMSIPVTTTLTPFYVCVTPKSHAAMPPPPGAVYAVTGTVTAFTSTNAQLGTDAGSATVTIDNASSPDVTAASATGAATSVTATWTNPGAGVAPATDFGSYVVVLGNTVAVTNAPAEGTGSYAAGGTIGSDSVVCSGNVATCQKTGLAAGQTYSMRIFTRDTANNWSAGVPVSASTTDARTTPVALSGSAPSCSLVNLSASYTGDTPTSNDTVTFARGAAAAGPFTNLTACTTVGGGANPRTCGDSTVAASTTYYYRATFADSDGIVGSASVDSGAVAVPVCAPTLAVTAGTMPAAASPAAGSSGTMVGRVVLTATGGTVTLDSLAVSNTGTALASSDVSTLSLFNDATGAFVGAGVWSSATAHWSFKGLALDVAAGSPITLRVVLGLNIGAAVNRTFARNVNVPADTVVVGPSTVSNATTIAGNTFTVAAGAVAGNTLTTAPMVSIVNPGDGKVVSPNNQYKVQIRVFNASAQGGIGGITANSVALSTDNGATYTLTATRNANYDAGTPTVTGATYEVLVTGQASGSYTLRARASNASVANVVSEPVSIVVGAPLRGDGNLLVRDNSSQLCSDCHSLPTHSSEAVGTKYGAWGVTCRDCHSPHGTRNVTLVNETITPPSVSGTVQAARNVGFVKTTGDSNAAGWDTTNNRPTPTASFANSDNTGPCQVCHTRTQGSGGVARWRNTGNADSHYTAAVGAQACTNCHGHGQGFGGGESSGGAACAGCHTAIKTMVAGTDATGTGSQPSKHSLVGYTDTFNDVVPAVGDWGSQTTLSAVPPAQRSCVNMCHADHPHDLTSPVVATHDNNLYLDPSTQATRGNGSANRTSTYRTKVDFDSTTNTGMCAKCHSKPIAAGRPAIAEATFGASAHDFTSTTTPAATWQYTLHDGGTTLRNCTKCHASRTEGNTPAATASGVTAVHGTPDPSLLSGGKHGSPVAGFVCYNCHGSTASPAAGAQGNRSNKDVQTQIAKTESHPVGSETTHDTLAEATSTAFPNPGFNGASRHVNCMDCHDPHEAGKTLRNYAAVATATRNQIPAGSPLSGVSGIQYGTVAGKTYPALPAAGAWPASTSASYGTSLVASATYEYEVCFKCHTAYAFGGTSAVTTQLGPSGLAETDLGMEFSPTMKSGHPVVQPLNSYTGNVAPKALAAAALTSTWAAVGTQTMTCTDCHYGDAAAPAVQGPHGSAVNFMLRGPNTYWPTNATGGLYALGNGSTAPTLTGLFCTNCHPIYSGTAYYNSAHTNHGSQLSTGAECIRCHILIPHGGKVSRLIGDRETMPTRYAYQGLLTNMYISSFTKAATPTGYQTGNCNANAVSACNTHNTTTQTDNW